MTLREDYNRDGYVVAKRDGCLAVKGIFNSIENPITFNNLNYLYHHDIDMYTSYLRAAAKIPELQMIFFADIIQNVLKEIGVTIPVPPTTPVLNVMGLPIPDGYNGTVAHQDWASIQGSLDMVTVWIPFMDIGIDNYPLEVIPGSHKRGFLDGKMNGSVLEVEADDGEFVPIYCNADDMIFISGFLVHRTGSGTGFRIAASQRFDNAMEPTFVERHYYCAQKRTVDREIIWKPTVEQVAKVFL